MRNIFLILFTILLTSFTQQREVKFYLISKPGIISNNGNIVYLCKESDSVWNGRFLYELNLSPGTYCYYNLDKSDTITFVIDKTGAYKLGFQEDHSSFSIFKNNPWVEL